ncbi:MAG TPA: hypothetical protein VN317_07645, partial [Candidatus Methanoperedens sp.]|nr:hypothetical protein [Candidatus Methanoperedens sp.]
MSPWSLPLLVASFLGSVALHVPHCRAATAEPPADAVAALRPALSIGRTAGGARLLSLEDLRLFYDGRGDRPAWTDAGRPSPQMDVLLDALRSADREGLNPADYHLAAIDDLRARLRVSARPAREAANDLLDLDLLLSDAFLLYAGHLTSGRVDPGSIEPEWNIPGRGRALPLLLSAALERGHLAATLAYLPPAREDYRLLRDALAALRAIAAAGGWPPVPAGPTLREGDHGPRIAPLR